MIIPVLNGAATLGEQLAALAAAPRPPGTFEVLVADSGSGDGSVEVARAFADRLPIQIVTAVRRGANVARNAAVRASSGGYLLFCDADDVVDETWLTRMHAALADGHELVVGRLDYRRLNDAESIRWRGASGAGASVHLDFLPAGHLSNLATTRGLFDRVGGLDESFIGGADDVDFCWRAQLAGAELHYLPEAVVHYRLRPSLRMLARQEIGYGAAEAQLHRKFAANGARRRNSRTVAREFWWLASRLPFTLRADRRGAWIRRAARQYGRFRGAALNRTWWW